MIYVGIVIVAVFVVVSIYLLNDGPMDREGERRQAYWARFEGKNSR